jgi:hypothetical protein
MTFTASQMPGKTEKWISTIDCERHSNARRGTTSQFAVTVSDQEGRGHLHALNEGN